MTELLSIAKDTAKRAADLAFQRRSEGVEIAATKSSITDVVTAADREVEQLVLGLLHEQRPDDGILGEEGASVEGTSGITWVVDPIDGTVNYLCGVGTYAVSIAAVEGEHRLDRLHPSEWKGLAGVVVDPTSDTVFTGAAGQGAHRNGVSIQASEQTSLQHSLVATGFGYGRERRARQAESFAEIITEVRDIRRIGSAALDLTGCAAGTLDAYFEKGPKAWDLAAGFLIAEEAGCATRVEEVEGELFAAVAAPAIATEFFALLKNADAASA